jgi:TOMM system kinase/cyclase fusion protein
MPVASETLVPGVVFDARYELLEVLGEGGFGVVYKAKQLATGHSVALKLMHFPEDADEARIEKRAQRFLRESKLCAELHHPNIIQLIDAGRDAEGRLYTVFAFAPGQTLAEVLADEGPLDVREARHLMLQVLDALSCAHAHGIVHRDLKPGNIMIVPTGARRNALVLDFGISAVVDGVGSATTRLTTTNETLGTPGYAAPEQWRGHEPTPSADIFSWGLVFLECLTGVPVYCEATTAELFAKQLGPEPVPLPPALAYHPLGDVLRQATDKLVENRTLTAAALLEAVEACDLTGISRGAREYQRVASAMVFADTRLVATGRASEQRQVVALGFNLRVTSSSSASALESQRNEVLHVGLALCDEQAQRFRGRLAAALGEDGVIYFGYPLAEEDDGPRAARAALAIVAAVAIENTRLASEGVALEVRLALHAGLVVTPDLGHSADTRLVTGCTPERAVFLARSTAPGTITVSEIARTLLREQFELTRLEEQSLHTLVDERSGATRGHTPDGQASVLVGREQELELLLDRWRRTRAGSGQCVLVTGEPGIGKSRLSRELQSRVASESCTVLEGRCSADAKNHALYPLIELLGRHFDILDSSSSEAASARFGKRLESLGLASSELLPLLAPLFGLPLVAPLVPLDVSPQKQKELTLQAILTLLFALSETAPALFILEDLHWADPSTLELLTLLVREVPSASLYTLLTARPEFSPAFPVTGTLQLHLNRLEPAQVAALVASILKQKAAPPAMLQQVVERTDGVPLFVEELTRMMMDSGVLLERGDRYELARTLSNSEIPGTLRALLTARLDRLGSRAKETAQLAAALGREFSAEVLFHASPQGASLTQQDIDALVASGLVFRRRRMKESTYVFKHALIRDEAYESMTPAGRKRAHASIAAALESTFPAIVDARPELMAHHHGAAQQYERAFDYGLRATRLSASRSQNEEAIAHGTATLSYLRAFPAPARAQSELSLNGLLTPALMARYGWGDARVKAQVERSRRILSELGPSPHRFPTLCSLAFYHHVAGNRADARALSQELTDSATLEGDIGGQVLALTLLGQCRWIEGDYIESEQLLLRALALYEPDSHSGHGLTLGLDTRVWAMGTLAQLRWFTGEAAAAREQMRSAVRLAEELEHVPTLGIAYMYEALVSQYAGDKATAGTAASNAIALAEKYGLPAIDGYCRFLRFWADDDAESAQPILNMMQHIGCRLGLDYYSSLPAHTLMERGEFALAAQGFEACIAMAEPMAEHYYEPELYRRAGLCKLRLEGAQRESARSLLHTATRMARQQGMFKTELDARVEEARHWGTSSASVERIAEIIQRRPQALDPEHIPTVRSLGIAVN